MPMLHDGSPTGQPHPDWLRTRRAALRISQDEIAPHAGIDQSTWSRFESGKLAMTREQFFAVSAMLALGTPDDSGVNWFLAVSVPGEPGEIVPLRDEQGQIGLFLTSSLCWDTAVAATAMGIAGACAIPAWNDFMARVIVASDGRYDVDTADGRGSEARKVLAARARAADYVARVMQNMLQKIDAEEMQVFSGAES